MSGRDDEVASGDRRLGVEDREERRCTGTRAVGVIGEPPGRLVVDNPLVGRRRRLLKYVASVDINRYRALIERLGLRR